MIAAGGTGGHVFPGLAVADALRAAGWRVVWLGSESGMEAGLVAKRGYEMAAVRFSGVRGKGPVALLLLPLKLLLAFWQSARAILAKRPDVVLGMGGYMSFPAGMMAALLGRPLAIHEQNSVAGLANRVLAGVADRVLCAFPGALKGAAHTGNPVRPEIAAIAAAGVPSILVPFPHAVDDHQTTNARFLADAGGAVLVPQSELTPEGLAKLIAGFDRERLLEMATRARSLGRPGATQAVARARLELAP